MRMISSCCIMIASIWKNYSHEYLHFCKQNCNFRFIP